MGLRSILLLVLGVPMVAWSAPEAERRVERPKAPEGFQFCDSGKEFRQAVVFFQKEPDLTLPDEKITPLALEVAKGCDGAALRFAKTFLFLKSSGVDVPKAIHLSMVFSKLSDESVSAFVEIYKRLLLENHLNLDFSTAYKLSLELSRDYTGDPKKIRDDFMDLVKFCLSEQDMALDYKTCAQLTLSLTRHTELYPKGVFPEFKKLYLFLRNNKATGLAIDESIKISEKVLAYGPLAPDNFIETLKLALSKKLNVSGREEILGLALKVSELSLQPAPEKP